jgi:hypothetical protein
MNYLLTVNGNVHPNTSKHKNIIKTQITSSTFLRGFQNGETTFLPGDATESRSSTIPCVPIHGSHRTGHWRSPFGFGTLVLNFCRIWRSYFSTIFKRVCRVWCVCSSFFYRVAPLILLHLQHFLTQNTHPKYIHSTSQHYSMHLIRDTTVRHSRNSLRKWQCCPHVQFLKMWTALSDSESETVINCLNKLITHNIFYKCGWLLASCSLPIRKTW